MGLDHMQCNLNWPSYAYIRSKLVKARFYNNGNWEIRTPLYIVLVIINMHNDNLLWMKQKKNRWRSISVSMSGNRRWFDFKFQFCCVEWNWKLILYVLSTWILLLLLIFNEGRVKVEHRNGLNLCLPDLILYIILLYIKFCFYYPSMLMSGECLPQTQQLKLKYYSNWQLNDKWGWDGSPE